MKRYELRFAICVALFLICACMVDTDGMLGVALKVVMGVLLVGVVINGRRIGVME